MRIRLCIRDGFALLAFLTACHADGDGEFLSDANPEMLVDQSGAVFGWDCSSERSCQLQAIPGGPPLPPCPEDEPPSYSYTWGRFFAITGVCLIEDEDALWSSDGDWARFVACELDEDCPQLLRSADRYECRAGLCQNVDTETHPPGPPRSLDMRTLCIGPSPRYAEDIPSPELVAAVEAACPDGDPTAPCESIPSACPNPT